MFISILAYHIFFEWLDIIFKKYYRIYNAKYKYTYNKCLMLKCIVQYIIIIIIVRTRFVVDRNSVWFAREKALTISFVERGFERLGLDRQAMGFSWRSYKVKWSSPLESFSWRWAGRLLFLAIFPRPPVGAPSFLLYSPSWLILTLHL